MARNPLPGYTTLNRSHCGDSENVVHLDYVDCEHHYVETIGNCIFWGIGGDCGDWSESIGNGDSVKFHFLISTEGPGAPSYFFKNEGLGPCHQRTDVL